jgi:hypothetical protein
VLSSVVVCNSAFALSRDFIYLYNWYCCTTPDWIGSAGGRRPELAHRSTCQSALRRNVRSVLVWSCSNNTESPVTCNASEEKWPVAKTGRGRGGQCYVPRYIPKSLFG